MERNKHKMLPILNLGEVKWKERIYRVCYEMIDTGEIYGTVRLYNKDGHFIKRFAMEPEVMPALGKIFTSGGR